MAIQSNIKEFLNLLKADEKKIVNGVSKGLEEAMRFISVKASMNFNPNRTGLRFSKKTGKPYYAVKNPGFRLRMLTGNFARLVAARSMRKGVIREIKAEANNIIATWGVDVTASRNDKFDYASYHEGKNEFGFQPKILRPVISPVLSSNVFQISSIINKNIKRAII